MDGSKAALQLLLDAGITNFDVDITHHNDDFYVIHPAEFAKIMHKKESEKDKGEEKGGGSQGGEAFKAIQTLDSFLTQIERHPEIVRVLSPSEQPAAKHSSTTAHHHTLHTTAHNTKKHVFITAEPKFTDKDPSHLILRKMVAVLQKNSFRQMHTAVVAGGTALQVSTYM